MATNDTQAEKAPLAATYYTKVIGSWMHKSGKSAGQVAREAKRLGYEVTDAGIMNVLSGKTRVPGPSMIYKIGRACGAARPDVFAAINHHNRDWSHNDAPNPIWVDVLDKVARTSLRYNWQSQYQSLDTAINVPKGTVISIMVGKRVPPDYLDRVAQYFHIAYDADAYRASFLAPPPESPSPTSPDPDPETNARALSGSIPGPRPAVQVTVPDDRITADDDDQATALAQAIRESWMGTREAALVMNISEGELRKRIQRGEVVFKEVRSLMGTRAYKVLVPREIVPAPATPTPASAASTPGPTTDTQAHMFDLAPAPKYGSASGLVTGVRAHLSHLLLRLIDEPVEDRREEIRDGLGTLYENMDQALDLAMKIDEAWYQDEDRRPAVLRETRTLVEIAMKVMADDFDQITRDDLLFLMEQMPRGQFGRLLEGLVQQISQEFAKRRDAAARGETAP